MANQHKINFELYDKNLYNKTTKEKINHKMKKKELEILLELLKDSNISDTKLASRVKLSRPSVSKIKNKLNELGIIERYTLKINPSMLGFNLITFILLEYTGSETEEMNFEKEIKALPNVIGLISFPGKISHMIILLNENLEEVERTIKSIKRIAKNQYKELSIQIASYQTDVKKLDLNYPILRKLEKLLLK